MNRYFEASDPMNCNHIPKFLSLRFLHVDVFADISSLDALYTQLNW